MTKMITRLRDIQSRIDEIRRGIGFSVARGKDDIGRQQLAAKQLVDAGYDRPITVPHHASEFQDDYNLERGPETITFRPEPKDALLLRHLAWDAHRLWRGGR